MAKKVSENEIQNISQDWGKDESNNLPYSGAAVQKFIKDTFRQKLGFLYYDTTSNRYLAFADEASKDEYLANPTQTELILGAFDAPFNYEASISLLSDSYVPVLLGSKGNYVSFDFDIKNKSGASVGESVNATWTFIRGNSKQTLKAKYRYGQTVSLNVDKYLSEGTNNIIITIVGETTLAATSVSVTYQVVNLQLSSDYNIARSYNLQAEPNAVAEIPFSVSGYGTKVVEWYLDGVRIPAEPAIDEVTGTGASRTKIIPLANLSQGSHALQIRAYTIVDGETFYSQSLYRDIIVYTGADTKPIIALSAELPASSGIVSGNITLEGATQYIPYVIGFAVYNPLGASVDVEINVDDKLEASVNAEGGVVNTFSYIPTTFGTKTITFTADATTRSIGLAVEKSSNRLEEITDALELDLQAVGKTNSSADKDVWKYGAYSTAFNGFKWNSLSGWNDGALVMGDGDSISINISPLAADATNNGKTMEFEFSTTGVSDDNAVVCDLRDASGTGLLITASKVSLISSGGKELTRQFKSEENIRVGLVINKDSGATNKGLAFLYINGINSGAVNFATTDNFISSKMLSFVGTAKAGIVLRSIRFYNAALTDEQMLNNFNLYRRSVEEMMEVYNRNDIYEEGTENFSMDKLANQLPVMIVTGDIPALEETTDKNKSIVVDIEYVNYQNPELSFKMKNAHMQPQGTSSMGYPKKNFRIYTQKRDDTRVYDYEGKEIENRLYSFKEGATPVNCWCLKADYAESSSTHNTSIARLWNDVMKNMKVDDEYVCRTQAQQAAIDSNYPYDVRTTIDGFPIVLAYRRSSTSDLVFIGKYNFNNDKETENVFGFKDIPNFDNSKMQCWEVLNNGNHLALFQDTTNFDKEWTDAFESRYPDTKTPNTADLKAFATWITTTTNFAAEKWQHLDVYKMAAYYVYVMRFGAVDQMVKNAMFTSEDGQKFYYINYDNDTINGLRNDGYLVYPPTITRQSLDETYTTEVYAYAGHDSRLWNYLEADTEFMQIVQVVDAELYNVGLTYANVIKMFDGEQSAKWCERVYNRDAQYKYVSPFVESGTDNLFMMQGSRQSHRRWWLSKRFSFIDSLFVSGEYKSNVVEMKLANAPIGLEFGIKAGIAGNYGYGVNNVAISYGIALEQGAEHTFRTAQVLNIGDPLRIYAAPNLEAIDLSNFIGYMSTLNVGGVYTDTLGTMLKTLKLGVDSANDNRRNTSLKKISGLASAVRLEELDIEGYQGITSVDLSTLNYLKVLKAKASGLTSISLPDGSPIERLELPSAIQGIVLSNVNNLTSANLQFEGGWANISTISFKRCPYLTGDWSMIKDWYYTKTATDSKCSLTMEGIEWNEVEADDIIALGNINTQGGVLNLKGIIRMKAVNSEQIAAIKAVYGEYVFVKGGELWFTAPDGIFITGADEVVEGDSIQLYGDIVSETPGTLTWSILSGSGATISENGLLTTTETGQARVVTVQIRHVPSIGAVVYNTKDISVLKAIRPSGGTITGDESFAKTGTYALEVSPSTINREYSVAWSVSGEATEGNGISIKSSDKTSCVLSALATASGHLQVKATVTADNGEKVEVTKDVLVGVTLKMNILSNQGEDAVIDAVEATVTHGSRTFTAKNGDYIGVPAYTLVTITFPDVVGYATPNKVEYMTSEVNQELMVTYNTTVVTVAMEDNQTAYDDITATKATVTSGDITATLSSGGSVKIPTGASCTISWSAVNDYRTPDTQTFVTSGASMTRTGTYQTEVVSVTVTIDDTTSGLSVNGAKITIDGTTYTWGGTAFVKKFPYGKTYTIMAADLSDDLLAPAAVSYVAGQASRDVVMTYATYKPDGIDLSLMDIHGNKTARHNTANCYVIREAGWYRLPLVYGNAIKNGVPNTEAYTNIEPSNVYMSDFVNYKNEQITSPFIEEDTGDKIVSASASAYSTDGLITQVRIIHGSMCNYISFKVNSFNALGENVLITANGEDGKVLWSWHIWLWKDDLTPVGITNETNVNYNLLPVPLGACRYERTGQDEFDACCYQWGRHTPFIHQGVGESKYGYSATPTTIGEAISNPTQMYCKDDFWVSSSKILNLWDSSCNSFVGNSDRNIIKTIYDPCPVGFKVPNGNVFSSFKKANIVGGYDKGWHYKANENDTIGYFVPSLRFGDIASNGELITASGAIANIHQMSPYQLRNDSKYFVYYFSSSKGAYGNNKSSGCASDMYSIIPVQDGTPLNTSYTTIRIDQNISDPATMIARTTDGGAIEAIRAHSHRYTGKKNDYGIMVLKQLDDSDGTRYLDGSLAELTTIGVDVWMKLPQFYYKAVEVSTDVWDITFAFGATPSGEEWKEWDGKDLIGVYKAHVNDSLVYSISGVKHSSGFSLEDFVNQAHLRGDGYSLVKMKHHNIMAFLFYAYYLNTDCQSIVGGGSSSSVSSLGYTDSLGMQDTTYQTDGKPINFWGLESWWGQISELVEGVVGAWGAAYITEEGKTRTVSTANNSGSYTKKIVIGEYLDVLAKEVGASATTGFCDYFSRGNANSVMQRSGITREYSSGISYVNLFDNVVNNYKSSTSRLCYRGDYIIE